MPYAYDIGIVIVNYNVRHFLAQCLQSIRNSQVGTLKLEIFVVDNASVDGSVIMLQNEFPEVNLIANHDNKGFAVANNQAIRQLRSRYVLMLNPDTVLEEDTLTLCHHFMENHSDAGAMGVRMIDGSGKFLPESKRKIPDLWNSFCKLSYLSEMFPKTKWFSGYNLGYLPESETNTIEVLCGAFMFIKAECLVKTGLLDESFFMYGEDIDLSYRIIQNGYRIYYYPKTSIVHYKGESTKKSSIHYLRNFYGAMLIYVNKHYGKGSARILSFLIQIAIIIRALVSGISKVITSILAPCIDALLIYPLLLQVKSLWASQYFNNPQYYVGSSINAILFIYTIVWVFTSWYAGHYEAKATTKNTVWGIGIGTVLILIAYALLPEYQRTSRALILLGSAASFVVIMISRVLINFLFRNNSAGYKSKNVAIVATKKNACQLEKLIRHADGNIGYVHFISPDEALNDAFFSSSLSNIREFTKNLDIKEIIFSSEDLSFKEIIRTMSVIGDKVICRIGADDSLSIIGSSSRHNQGESYQLNEPFSINSWQNKRIKRWIDLFFCIIFIPCIPLLYLLNGFKISVIRNLFLTLIGHRTMVGYGGKPSDYDFLPAIRKGIINYPLSKKMVLISKDHFKVQNRHYAQNYEPWTDVKIILSNLYKLGQKG